MANSTLTLYSTDIDISRNMVVEDIEDYLATRPSTSIDNIGNVMYVKPGLDTKIRIPWDQARSWTPAVNYAKVIIPASEDSEGLEDGEVSAKTCYYYITKAEWKSTSTVELSLKLDTLNTYWNVVKPSFRDETHITRQHQNRYYKNGMRKIDKFDEGIGPVSVLLTKQEVKAPNTRAGLSWYLIYRSDSTDTDSGVSCFCCADDRIPHITGQTANTVRWDRNQFVSGYYYYIVFEDDISDAEVAVQYGANPYTHITTSSANPIIKMYLNGNGYIEVRYYAANGTAATGYPYNIAHSWVDFIKTRRIYYSTQDTVQLSDIYQMSSDPLQAGDIGDLYLNSISSVNRSDPLLIKIIQLAYPPFDVTYTSGNIDTPTGWTYDTSTGQFKVNSVGQEFGSNLNSASLFGIMYEYSLDPSPTSSPSIINESKLYNSNFYKLKFGYDSFSWTFAPEDVHVTYTENNLATYPVIDIAYKPSNAISSNCGFYFNYDGNSAGGYQDQHNDFGGYLLSDRNNEMPLFSNEYLNYLKYGKQYADKTTAINVTSTWLQSLLSIGGGILGGAVFGGAPGAIVGAAIGAVSGISSAITNTVKTIDAQQQKEWELQHQITNINSNNDVNLFDWYSKNKLYRLDYEPTDIMKNLLWQLFFRGGYACDTYAVPNLNNRYWFNFVQCEPVFSTMNVYQDYIDDIKEHFRAGVSIFHNRNGAWDLDYNYENWEQFWFGYDINDLTVTHSTVSGEHYDTVTFTGHWSGDALNGTTQYIQIEYFITETEYNEDNPRDTEQITPDSSGNFTTSYDHQGLYAVRFTVVDTENTEYTSDPLTIIGEFE